MATWKKVVVSGSDTHLHNLTASNNVVVSGSVEILGDLVVTGDDITMGSNTDKMILVADGTNFNPVVSSGDVVIANNGASTIQADAVTYSKLQNLGTANRVLGSTSTGLIGEVQIVTAMIANDAIEEEQIGDGEVKTAAIANDAVNADKLASAAVVNDSVADSAAIAYAKLAAMASGRILVGNGSNVATVVAVSGDATMANNGALSLAAAQTNVNSILATDLVLGEDSQTKIDFETANEIHFDAANAEVVNIAKHSVNISGAVTSSGIISASGGIIGDLTGTASFVSSIAGAGITNGKFLVGDGSGNAAEVNMSNHATMNNAGAVTIENDAVGADQLASNAVVNASIAANAAIAHSKLAALASTKVLVGNGSNVATEVVLSGDVALANNGAVTIQADAVTYSKLQNLGTANRVLGSTSTGLIGETQVVTAMIANDAIEEEQIGDGEVKTAALADDAVDADKLAANAVVNASIASNAAIAHSKLAALASTKILVGNGSNVATEVVVSGDATLANNGALSLAAAQTNVNSILATDLVLGEDSQTKIDFETANEIHFYANNVEQVYVADNIFGPQSDSDVDLGSNGVRWKDAFVDSLTVTGDIAAANAVFSGNLTVQGDLTSIQTATLNVEDKMIVLASGSTSEADSGLIVQSTATAGHGFGYDASLGRWIVESGSLINATAWGAKGATEYVAIVSASAAAPSAAPFYGGTSTGHGNFAVDTAKGDLWIYA